MKLTVLGFLWFITFIPYLFLAGYSFLIEKNFLFGLLFLGLEVFNIKYIKGRIHYDTPEEKTIVNFGKLAYSWSFILLFSFLLFRNMFFGYIFFWLMWIPFIVFLLWAACSGKWGKISKLRF
ncbi:MAG: hypothetical protein HXS44_15465 [Theionarchaea archaeon]|nr:hypothetical protein [Theionarchaea archaeon]